MFFRSLNIWFWAIVGLPTLLAGVYFFAIASDLYLSEVKFLVRGPTKPQQRAQRDAQQRGRLGGAGGYLRGSRISAVARRGAPARAGERSAHAARRARKAT